MLFFYLKKDISHFYPFTLLLQHCPCFLSPSFLFLMILFCLSVSSTLTIFSARFFPLLCSWIQNAEHLHLSFPQDSFLCSCCPFFKSSTPLFTLCLCLFSTTSAEESASKDEKQRGSASIPPRVHGSARGSVPLLGEQSNWHHSHPCGTGQWCYVAQATIPNCLLGCWKNKMGLFLLVCLKVTVAWWHWTQGAATAGEALQEPQQAALQAQTHQSHRKPHLFCSLSHAEPCVQQLSCKTTTATMPETMLF